MGIAPMSKIDNPKSSTSLVYLTLPKRQIRRFGVGDKQNLQMPFSELFHVKSPKNQITLSSNLTPSSIREKQIVRWLQALS